MLLNIQNEFEHLVKIEHENIIRVYELLIDKDKGEIYLLMEYFEGKELFMLISEVGNYDGNIIRKNSCKNVKSNIKRN